MVDLDDDNVPLYERVREQFRLRQLEKNAESIRTHHPEYRRHQKAIKEEIAKVEDVFLNTRQDVFVVTLIETMFHFKDLRHPTNPYVVQLEGEEKIYYEVHRKPETPTERAARLKRLDEIEAAKNPKRKEEEEDEDDGE